MVKTSEDIVRRDAQNVGIRSFAVGAALFSSGKILLVHRVAHDFKGGLWEIPGGKVENKESFFDALVREVSEETGLRVISVGSLVSNFDYRNESNQHIRQLNYHILTYEGNKVQLDASEHDAYQWVGLHDLSAFPMSSEMQSSITLAFSYQ